MEQQTERIPVAGPWITAREVEYVTHAAANAWYDQPNTWHDRFERAFAERIGVRHAVALPSCTSAIHLALAALGIGPEDEVIIPEITWIATAAPVSYVGAQPVFADIDPVTWCLSAESFERHITPRTRAVIPVDLYGGVPDYDAICAIARDRGITVIEDAAEALGAAYRGRAAGSLGQVGVFSFHGSKTLTTGEGGMLVTNDSQLFERVLFLRDHGRVPGDRMFCNAEVAYKYKMSSLQAALGAAQLERLDELVGRKREIFEWYREALSDIAGLTWNAEPDEIENSFWMSTVVLPAESGLTGLDLMHAFDQHRIDSRPFFRPLSSLPAFQSHPQAATGRLQNPCAYDISPRGLNLPSALILSREQIARVSAVVRELMEQRSSSQTRAA
ncbi:MAG TPA: DegT/DnrJ/EryC1/StrS family aminotransferase [Planctomycetaceae bacterium]|nr:DegT/DnrJ/EryC1/StrS family aminotransferase [Planctomycetaceae bacterium]